MENKGAEVVQRSSHRHAGASRSTEDNTASQVPCQANTSSSSSSSSSSSRPPSDQERSRVAKGSQIIEHCRMSPSPIFQTEAQPRASSRDQAAYGESARHTHQKHTRHSYEYRKHRQAEAEGRLHISPAGSDGLRACSRERRSSRGYQRKESEGRTSIESETKESDR